MCPCCIGQWVAAAFVGGYIARPPATRATSSMFAALHAVSDLLRQRWVALDKRA